MTFRKISPQPLFRKEGSCRVKDMDMIPAKLYKTSNYVIPAQHTQAYETVS
jgi:hypothetical protein